jgi:hypothetical protein
LHGEELPGKPLNHPAASNSGAFAGRSFVHGVRHIIGRRGVKRVGLAVPWRRHAMHLRWSVEAGEQLIGREDEESEPP